MKKREINTGSGCYVAQFLCIVRFYELRLRQGSVQLAVFALVVQCVCVCVYVCVHTSMNACVYNISSNFMSDACAC